MYGLVAVLSGMMVAAQGNCNGLMFPILGVMGVGCLSQFLNAASIFAYTGISTGRPPSFKGFPLKASWGGILGIFVVGLTGLCVARAGTAVTVCLSVAGQLLASAAVDHFGILGAERVPFEKKRLVGFGLILAGMLVINGTGGEGPGLGGGMGLAAVLALALACGCMTVFARMFSFYACQKIGLLNGSFANVAVGAGAAFAVCMVMSGFRPDPGLLLLLPPVSWLTGALGAGACILNTVVYRRLKIFKATVLIIAGQIGMGLLADVLAAGHLPAGKLAGIGLVCLGIAADKRLSVRAAGK